MMKRILVGLAGTPYTKVAIREAVDLATRHGSEVTGVTVVDVQRLTNVGSVPIGAEESAKELREHRMQITSDHVKEAVGSFESACGSAGVPFKVVCEEGDAFRLMQDHSRYHDLTIFGMRSVFEYYFDDAESSKLLARLIGAGVRPIVAVSQEYRPVQRALIAYNGSMGSAKTLRRFVQMGLWPDAKVRIVTFDRADGDQLLADAAAYFRAHGVEAEVEHVREPSKDRLLPYADEWDADLICLGNSGGSFLMRQLFGETALHVMQHSDRPLFLSQ